MFPSPETFVGWIKRHVVALEEAHGRNGIANLSTSGVHTATIDGWFERICRERLPELLDRMAETNEYGLPALKAAIRRRYLVPDDREVYLTAGASAAYRLVCESLLAGSLGRDVLVESPTYQPLGILPQRFVGSVLPVPIPINRAPGDVAAACSRAVRRSTVALVLSNLHNPTSSFVSRAELKQVADAARVVAPRITVVVDETFLGLGPGAFWTAADLDPCIITVSSLTKTFGLGQLRCGWVIADKGRYPNLLADWIQFESIGSKILEALSLMAFEQLDALLKSSLEHLAVNRAIVVQGIEGLREPKLLEGEVPASGCVFYPRWTGRTRLDVAATRLFKEFGVLVSPGRFFGNDCADYFRIGFGGSAESVRTGIERLTRGLRAMA